MAVLEPRFHSFSTIHQDSQSGWNFCMSKAYCKWPAIIGIIIAIIVFALTAFCCVRCCMRRRRGGGGRNRRNTVSMFNPAPYQGYQPANNPHNAPPPYGEPARYAQFDMPGGGKKVTGDSLPAMPSWDTAKTRQVEQEGDHMEMGHMEKSPLGHRPMNSIGANASSTNLLQPHANHAESDNHTVTQNGQLSPHYTGPDFGHGAGHPYTGPDFGGVGHGQQTAYTAYAPSESTRYEPSGANEPQELGTTYNNTQAPSVLQAGRRPENHASGNSFRDV
ncbi:hypothetical protein ACLMJK_008040 [Lecanora helva]